ncbi:hypothetical protein FACS1894191_1960 [Clostridia bacterium]|nr:hypothetical protein FACS1894191_1960 [Clostridia bacterium]
MAGFFHAVLGHGGINLHAAPGIDKNSPVELFNRAFDTVTMFRENDGRDGTVIRAFGAVWEQPLSSITAAPSVLRRLEQAKEQAARRNAPAKQKKKSRSGEGIVTGMPL